MSLNLNEMNCFAFLLSLDSMSRSLTRIGRTKDLNKLRSCFALLNQNTCNTLQYRSKCSCSSFDYFSWTCKNWVETQVLFSNSSCFMSNLTCYRRLWRWESFPKMRLSLIFIVVWISWDKFFCFCFALARENFKSSNERCNKVIRIRVAEENCFFHKVWNISFRQWDMLPYPHCCLSIFEGLLLDTKCFNFENC